MPKLDQTTIENSEIRRQWDENSSTWYFSVIDTIALVTNSSDPRNYWKVLKNRLKNSYPELVTTCNQLKMRSSDGKFYLTDVMDTENILKLVNNISPSDTPIFRTWLQNFKQKNAFDTIEVTEKEEKFRANNSQSFENIWDKVEEKELTPVPVDGIVPVDIFKQNDQIIVIADIASTIIDDVFISVTTKNITIKGTRNKKINSEDIKYKYKELKWGTFSRTLPLPYEVDLEKIEAIEKNGILTIRLNIIDKQKNKIVKIKSLG
jgi:HSP20 family molecular chaperone IbpA